MPSRTSQSARMVATQSISLLDNWLADLKLPRGHFLYSSSTSFPPRKVITLKNKASLGSLLTEILSLVGTAIFIKLIYRDNFAGNHCLFFSTNVDSIFVRLNYFCVILTEATLCLSTHIMVTMGKILFVVKKNSHFCNGQNHLRKKHNEQPI